MHYKTVCSALFIRYFYIVSIWMKKKKYFIETLFSRSCWQNTCMIEPESRHVSIDILRDREISIKPAVNFKYNCVLFSMSYAQIINGYFFQTFEKS